MNQFILEQALGALALGFFALAMSSTILPFSDSIGLFAALGVVFSTAVYSNIPAVESIEVAGQVYA